MCLYSPAADHRRPLAGTTFPWRDGQAEFILVVVYAQINFPLEKLNPYMITHPGLIGIVVATMEL